MDILQEFCYDTSSQRQYVTFGNNTNAPVQGFGIITNGNFTIRNVAYVAGLKHNLISVAQLTDAGYFVGFDDHHSYVMSKDRQHVFIKSGRDRNMYPLDLKMVTGQPQLCLLAKADSADSWLWHRRLCHLKFRYINDLVSGEMVRGLPLMRYDCDHLCAACECGKQTKVPHFVIPEKSISDPLELLHIDLCGPSTVQSLHHKKYILVIVDDFTRYTWVC